MFSIVPEPSRQDDQAAAVLSGLQSFTRLPDWLTAITQPRRVHDALIHSIPEFASGELRLEACRARQARFKQNRWMVIYQLTIAGPCPEQRRIMNVRGTLIPPGHAELALVPNGVAFGAKAWRCHLSELCLDLEMQPPDSELPALPLLTEPEQARTFLEQSIRAGSPAYHDIRIQACIPQVVRYKPGSRCTVLYQLEYPAYLTARHHWPNVVVAKTYRGQKGQNAYDSMYALWNSTLAASNTVTIAEPLAYVPGMNVLVQGPIRGEQTLQDLIRSSLHTDMPQAIEELHEYMRKTAVGLVELHRSEVRFGHTRVWEDELAEVQDGLESLIVAAPQLADAAMPLLKRLNALAAGCPPDPWGPSHGTFRPAQVLLNQGRIGFIDFDGFCRAEPALDLALFLAKVKDIGLSASEIDEDASDENVELLDEEAYVARLAQLDSICQTFLDGYETLMTVSRRRVALWEALAIFTLVLHSWTKVKPVRLKNSLRLLEHHLRRSGLLSL